MKKQNPNVCKTTKEDRRKKFNKFKDVMHKNFGSAFVTVGVCLKNCFNKGKKCNICWRFSELKEKKDE